MPIRSGSARLAGVVGWPVAHSRSPRLHNHWLRRHGLDGAYVPLPVSPDRLPDALRGLVACGFAGANVTIPHKEAVLALCDALDPSAARAGAVNTLLFAGGRVIGRNTDGEGFLANLAAHGVDPSRPALILGAGGSARAVAAALLAAGATVAVSNRNPDRAEALCAALPGLRAVPWAARDRAAADHGLLVNATPAGMNGDATVPVALDRVAPGCVVADLVYVPRTTPLLAAAQARGLFAVGGLGMLLHQAVPGFAAWFGVVPEVDAETEALVAADLPG